MTLDIRGGLKNTAVNSSDYVVFEELLSNSLDSYLIRKNTEQSVPKCSVVIDVGIVATDLLHDEFDVDISCTDNGAGFGDAQVKAFVTKDSTYKDQLQIQGIGKCKGAGRIQYFHRFGRLSIESTFPRGESVFRRTLFVDETSREISEDSFTETLSLSREVSTTLKLAKYRTIPLPADQKADRGPLWSIYAADAIGRHLYTSFLQRLVVLKALIGEFRIDLRSKYTADGHPVECKASIESKDLPEPAERKCVPLICTHSKEPRNGAALRITRYSFPETEFPNFEHEVALCANSAVVQQITRRYLRSSAERQRSTNGRFELILTESDLLESSVNHQRDGFDIPVSCGESETLDENFSLEDIVDSLEDYVFGVITPQDFDKDALVKATEQKFGITKQMLEGANVKIHYGDSEENIARRVLKKLQEEIVGDTSRLFKVKDELLKLDPRSADFRQKLNELSWKYTSTIKKMDMTNLSQLVVRRTAMLEVLKHAVEKLLVCQEGVQGKRNEHERVIHNVFFPTGKDSKETRDHDIWLLNEEYQYFEYIASDKPLKSLRWPDGNAIFDPDIDDSLAALFARNNADHQEKRPDIALFTQEGAAIIIEFKSPDVEIQEHIPDLAQYARLLAAKSNGRIRKFYGYLIGCKLDPSRMVTGWTRFANSRGYFSTGKLVDEENDKVYGELYSELLFYQQFIERAELRLGVYKNKLRVQLD